ncbi:glycosyltransferase [Calditerrivibrio sp.]|uniref:glycosyltransferase n=1 Tax=Calditerrivibrio sp. TaxID=2792612 RepID=UPI003D0B268F
MRYLIIGDGNSPHLLKWAKTLKKDVDLYLFSFNRISDELKSILGEKKAFSANLSVSQTGGNYSILKYASLLNSIIKYVHPDIVNPHYITSNGFMAVLVKKLMKYDYKIVSSCWGSDILVNPNRNFLYKKITRYILKHSDLITSDSYSMTDKILDFCNKRVLTFPFGVENIPNVTNKEPLLFFSNRMLKPNYNIDKIVSFFKNIHDRDKRSRLIIANDGVLRDDILGQISSLGLSSAVEYVGFLSKEKQDEIYAKSTFYISIPDSDATSVSLLEAMSFGCIPIVSNIPSNREWVWDGYNGFYFDGNIDRLFSVQSRIDEFLKINQEIIRKRGLWQNNISNFLKVIYEL